MPDQPIEISWPGITLDHDGPYIVQNLTGWGGVEGRIEQVARANAHGSFGSGVWSESRTVLVEGFCNSLEDRNQLFQDMGRSLVLTGDAPDQPLSIWWADQQLTANAKLRRWAPTTYSNWGVGNWGWVAEWWCADPFRYGTTSAASTGLPEDAGGLIFPLFADGFLDFGDLGSPGRVTLTNPGSAPAYPRYEVTGPVPSGFELRHVETGFRLRWGSSVPAGSVVTLDCRTAQASFDDSPGWDGQLTKRQWHTIPAGGSATIQFLGLGSYDAAAELTATWQPTYW